MATAAGVRPLDQAIRTIPSAWFRPDRRLYWADMLGSAAIGWTALAASLTAGPWPRAALIIVAVFALYRAVLFIHEISHLAPHDVPAFRGTWNAVIGVPMLLPSFLYEGVHTDHHRQRCYATPADPEYVPFARRRPLLLVAYGLGSALLPVMLAIRFGLLAPLSWPLPRLRRVVAERLSALVINHRYLRHAAMDRAALAEEAAAAALVWTVAILRATGHVTAAPIVTWLIATALASSANAVRTLAAHLYDRDDGELSMTEQLLDTCTLTPQSGVTGMLAAAWRGLWAPVGLRYHALHHWIPSLPYHNLGRAHRLLVATLAHDSPYAATQHEAIAPLVRDLVRRSWAQQRG